MTTKDSYCTPGKGKDMKLIARDALFAFHTVSKPLVRTSLLAWVVLALTFLIVLGVALHSEDIFLLGLVGFVGLPLVLGAVAMILLPFTK